MKHFIILLVIFSNIVMGQGQKDDCIEVLLYASKDIKLDYSKANVAKYIYDKYCEGSSSKTGISIGYEDEDLLSSSGFNFGTTQESISNICKTYQSSYKIFVESDQKSSTVVREAISAWLECKKLSNKGIKINPNIQDTQFSIDFARESADIEINGIDYDPKNCSCVARVKVNGKIDLVTVDSKTTHKINDEKYWNLRCKRISSTQNGHDIFDEVNLRVPTSKGTFVLNLPRNVKPDYTWVSDIVDQISNLKIENEKLKTNLTDLSSKITTVNSRFGKVEVYRQCINVASDCNGQAFESIIPPAGYINAPIIDIDTYPGGQCGQGSKCKTFIRFID